MNTQSKAFNAILRLKNVKKATMKEPSINQLYSIEYPAGTQIIKVVARYAGRSKSGKYFNFEVANGPTSSGAHIHLACFDTLPSITKKLRTDLFHSLTTRKRA